MKDFPSEFINVIEKKSCMRTLLMAANVVHMKCLLSKISEAHTLLLYTHKKNIKHTQFNESIRSFQEFKTKFAAIKRCC